MGKRRINRLPGHKYSKQQILAELRRTAGALGKQTLTIRDVNEHARVHYGTVKKYFGGLTEALGEAGLQAKDFKRGIPREALLDELERLWDKTATIEGRRPHKKDLRRYNAKYGQDPYYRVFGSWIKALEAVMERGDASGVTDAVDTTRGGIGERHRVKRRVPLRLRLEVLKRDDYTCQACGRSPANTKGIELHVDHIMPLAKGGTNVPENLQTLCNECNLGKGDL